MSTNFSIAEELDCECLVRDGTILRTDVYRPAFGGAWPVLLCRTPYDKRLPVYRTVARDMAARGYVVAVQDIRGRYASDGEYVWMFSHAGQDVHRADGVDAVGWASALPGSDGRVALWGNSYASFTAWRASGEQPPALAGMFTSGIAPRTRDQTQGLFEIGRRLHWAFCMAADLRRRNNAPFGPYSWRDANQIWTQVERGKWIWRLPLDTMPDDLFWTLTPQVRRLMQELHCEFQDFGQIHPLVTVPVSCLTGWWDRLLGGVNNYAGMVANGPAETRGHHRLMIGPWGHDAYANGRFFGGRDHGPDADVSYISQMAAYFDKILKGRIANGEAPVRAFILNENRWHDSTQWPPESTVSTTWFLAGTGGANTTRGDGVLDEAPWGEPDRFRYDPADPVMSLMALDGQSVPYDQSPLAHRRDILVYQTRRLEQDVVILGPVVCHLWAATDAPDTDFTAKLVEVAPDGGTLAVASGIYGRATARGSTRRCLRKPGSPMNTASPWAPPESAFARAAAFAWIFRLRIFPASIAITTPAAISGATPSCASPARQCSTTPSIRHVWCCR